MKAGSTRDKPLTLRATLGFLGLFVLLYAAAVVVAEWIVARGDTETAFQKLLAARGAQVDWLVLGASHALPLEYGDVPGRLEADTGQSMLVLAEIGAGPLYIRFVLDQALQDLQADRLLFVLDDFAFHSPQWNEDRVAERSLLRRTPYRFATARSLAGMVFRQGVDPRGLVDYLTGFSKLNPPQLFPPEGWRGAAAFEGRFRPSRHAVQSRLDYLYPEGQDAARAARYLDAFEGLVETARASGLAVTVMKPPLPDAFRTALPEDAEFEQALHDRLERMDLTLHDFSEVLGEPELYFDTDHLNDQGVDAFYRNHLRALLASTPE
jgi:hypothetical protein